MFLNLQLKNATFDHISDSTSHPNIPENWGIFLLYEGCFQLNETPAKERTDAENNNHVCNDYCDRERKKHFPRPLVSDAYALTAAPQTVCQKVNATLRVQKLPLQMLRKVHRVVKILDVVVPRRIAL